MKYEDVGFLGFWSVMWGEKVELQQISGTLLASGGSCGRCRAMGAARILVLVLLLCVVSANSAIQGTASSFLLGFSGHGRSEEFF